jgi:hypothetical protein
MARSGSKYAPWDYEPVPYPLTGGVDTKFHGIALPPPKLQTCENAYVDQTGSIQRRFGRAALSTLDTAGATITGWLASASYQGRLLGFTGTKLYDYSAATSRWIDAGRCTSWRVRTTPVDAGDIGTTIGGARDMAVIDAGGFRCYAYEYYEPSGVNYISRVAVTLVDASGIRYTTNKVLATSTAAAARAASVRVVAHGALFYVVYWDTNTAADLKCFIIDTTSAATITASLAASATTLASNLGLNLATYAPIDVCENIWHGPFVCYRSTVANTINLGHITSAGALTHTTTASSGAADCVNIGCDVTVLGANNVLHGVVFTLGTAPNDVYSLLRQYTGAAWVVTASSGAMDTAIGGAGVRAVACTFDSATKLRVFYDNDLNVTYPCIRQGTFTTAGVIDPRVEMLPRSYLASRPFTGADGSVYFWCVNEPLTRQPTLFLMKTDGTLAGVANQGIAVVSGLQPYGMGHVPSSLSGASFSLACGYFTAFGTNGVGTTTALKEVIVDMTHADSHVAVEDGSCLYIPSAVLQSYDGVSCTEVGFLQYVDTQNRILLDAAASSNGAGSLNAGGAAGTLYAYRVVPEWTNAQGEREQGTDSGPKVTAAFALNDDTVTFTIDCIPWTLKQAPKSTPRRTQITFAIYRTLKNPSADSPHYRVGTVQNIPALDTVTFVDTMSDAVAATQEQLKFDVELDAVAPAPGHIVAAGNGRVFVAGLPDDPNLVMYSKTRGHGEPLTFNDALLIQFPTSTGPIRALAVMNDSLIAFCERAIYRVNGNGTNNTGTVGGFTEPVLVATNDGAVGPRGCLVTPGGIMFDSSTRGISLMPPSLGGTAYIGAPLEKLTDPGACTGAVVVPELQQVRFSFASVTYVYDYYHSQWYVFTHGSDGPTCVWGGDHVGVDGPLVVDDATAWTDAGTSYTMELTLGFVTGPQAKRSDLAIRSIGLTGVSLAAHALSVYLRYDLGAVLETVIETTIVGAGVLEPRWRIGQQHCSSLEVTIRDALLDVYGADVVAATAGMKLNELVFELGVKTPGLGRDV